MDTLSDDRAGCPHERPELGVVELVRVETSPGTPIPLRVHRDRPVGCEDRRLSSRLGRLPSRRGSPPLRTAPAVAAPHRPRRLSRAGTPGRRRCRSGTVRCAVRWSRAIDAQASLVVFGRDRASGRHTRPCQASWPRPSRRPALLPLSSSGSPIALPHHREPVDGEVGCARSGAAQEPRAVPPPRFRVRSPPATPKFIDRGRFAF